MNWTVLKRYFAAISSVIFRTDGVRVHLRVRDAERARGVLAARFFSNNLANLDQLIKWLPFFCWCTSRHHDEHLGRERRQHTDELLLTLPASDTDVVVGKYLAGVAIYTVALLFSMFSIYLVFSYGLGTPDTGLFIGTYVGYWFVGLACSPGMVRVVPDEHILQWASSSGWSSTHHSRCSAWLIGSSRPADGTSGEALERARAIQRFQRGVISLSGISYFVMIAIVMIYISVVLIGRAALGRPRETNRCGPLSGTRVGLVAIAVGINLLFRITMRCGRI